MMPVLAWPCQLAGRRRARQQGGYTGLELPGTLLAAWPLVQRRAVVLP